MILTPENLARCERLIAAMREQPLILFTGAGASIDAGYPPWSKLLGNLHEKVTEKLVAMSAENEPPRPGSPTLALPISPKQLPRLADLDDVLWRAEAYRLLLGEQPYQDYLRRVFGVENKPGETLNLLMQLNFRHYVTTNYETSLEQACREKHGLIRTVDWTNRAEVRRFFAELRRNTAEPHVVYLHGRYDAPADMVLTDRDYVNRYILSNDSYPRLLALFMMERILLVGFSLEDPQFQNLFRAVNAHLGSGEAKHFMLTAALDKHDSRRDEIRALILQHKYGILPIFYDPADNHAALKLLLRALKQAVTAYASGEPAAQALRQAWLRDGVRAKNVNLKFALDPNLAWKQSATSAQQAARLQESQESLASRKPGPEVRPETRRRQASTSGVPPGAFSAIHPDDPHKGQFGGRAVRQPYSVRAKVSEDSENTGWYNVQLVIERSDRKPFEDGARFYLHPTFRDAVVNCKPEPEQPNRITFNRYAWGAFTVGVEIIEDGTRLELDLAELLDAPTEFRSR